MDPRIETVLRDWRFRSCDPGYAGLQALADAEFSGAISSDDARGFMVNGRLVGISGGSIESFWSSDLSAREADDPALPLLCAMLVSESEVEAEYYTGETPIAQVDDTLSSGSFTGYLELSENVFSGDYFVLYYGGTSRSVAILGNEDRLITGSEAFERANDEVGIYEVKTANVEVIDIPEPEVDESGSVAAEPPRDSEPEPEEAATAGTTLAEPATPEEPAAADEPVEQESAAVDAAEPERQPEMATAEPRDAESLEPTDIASLAEAAMGGGTATAARTQPADDRGTTDPDEWVTIPALDPDRTTLVERQTAESSESIADEESDPSPATSEEDAEPDPPATPDETGQELADAREALETAERENEQLRARIDELEEQLAAQVEAAAAEEKGLSAAEALDGTNLFVRYESKMNYTLDDAQSGSGEPAEIRDNIRLEWHTTFDDEAVTVEGESFESFLRARIEYRFATWLLEELLFELRETGREKGLGDLFTAIPEVDRVEFNGEIPVHTRADGERRTETFEFDLVLRNGMGDPLLVVAVHDDRAPADEETVGRLLADANRVATARESLGAALFVTRSYFEPPALETVADATGGSFLGRGSKESYVSVSRKRGFHLCLVEARNDTFHLNVPEG